MTETEKKLFRILQDSLGEKYYIFPQVHLDALLNHKVNGQKSWRAFHHINQKSVDFVLADKINLNSYIAIELDDRSHDLPNRVERDIIVNQIFKEANVPMLRIKVGELSSVQLDLSKRIEETIGGA